MRFTTVTSSGRASEHWTNPDPEAVQSIRGGISGYPLTVTQTRTETLEPSVWARMVIGVLRAGKMQVLGLCEAAEPLHGPSKAGLGAQIATEATAARDATRRRARIPLRFAHRPPLPARKRPQDGP